MWISLLLPLSVFAFNGLSATFLNLANRKLRVYWVPGAGYEPQLQKNVPGNGGESSLTAYIGNNFFWSEVSATPKPVNEKASFTIVEDLYIYAFSDATTPAKLLQDLAIRLNFMDDYFNRTGRHWLAVYPRPPPKLFMWSADYVGQEHVVPLSEEAKQHVCDPKQKGCHSEVTELTVKVLTTVPRAFKVENFLTDYESDWVIEAARPNLKRSTTGHGEDASENSVRSSRTWWLLRGHAGHDIADSIYRRIADVLNIPHELLFPSRNSESINVLHYQQGQEYTPHYDWWSQGRPEYRYISILLYFSTPTKGGGTFFPMAKGPDGSEGVRTAAVKNQCVFFYDMLPDGNVDEYSLHSGEPVEEGEKWVGPLWIWDPNVFDGLSPDPELKAYESRQKHVASYHSTASKSEL